MNMRTSNIFLSLLLIYLIGMTSCSRQQDLREYIYDPANAFTAHTDLTGVHIQAVLLPDTLVNDRDRSAIRLSGQPDAFFNDQGLHIELLLDVAPDTELAGIMKSGSDDQLIATRKEILQFYRSGAASATRLVLGDKASMPSFHFMEENGFIGNRIRLLFFFEHTSLDEIRSSTVPCCLHIDRLPLPHATDVRICFNTRQL